MPTVQETIQLVPQINFVLKAYPILSIGMLYTYAKEIFEEIINKEYTGCSLSHAIK